MSIGVVLAVAIVILPTWPRLTISRQLAASPVYRAATRTEFQERMTSLKTWVAEQELPSTVQTYVDKLTALSGRYAEAYDHPGCHRTRNMVDRLMNLLDRAVH